MTGASAEARVAIVSLGCAKNLVDSEVMAGLLQEAGFDLTGDTSRADVVVVNTCGFIEPAQRESVDAILELARARSAGRLRGLVVAGCLPRRFSAEEVAQELPEVDAVIGTAELPMVADVVRSVLRGQRVVLAEPAPSFLYHHRLPRLRSTPGHLAYVKVSEGCDHPCTFCTIPRIRGPYRSRPMESIVEEVRRLADEGVQEVVLIGQDTTMYGADLYGRLALPELLRRLGQTGIPWIRLLYAYPAHVTPDLLAAMAETPAVCHYLDVPLQHASDRILRAMRRWGSRQAYERLLAAVREAMPDAAVRTTFIVGFPGETEADVEALLDFVEGAELDHVGVFVYSREQGTPAAAMEGQVPAREKGRRRAAVMARQQAVLERVARRRLGARVPLLLERPGRSAGEWMARSPYQAPEVDGVTWIRVEGGAPGQRVEGCITGRVGPYDYRAVAQDPGLGGAQATCYNRAARASR
ncbi:MAG TPA: 30S ribosomal protein S12 methylthiotransferase RimO [Limnochordales bacterium]